MKKSLKTLSEPISKVFLGLLFFPFLTGLSAKSLPLHTLKLPDGFSIEVYADNVPNARSMIRSDKGTLFVGTRRRGYVYALRDEDGDYIAEKVYTIAEGLNMPNGVAVKDGNLYVAEVNRVLRFDDIEKHLADPPEPVVIYDGYPSDSHHGWKFLRFGPDGRLYIQVGAPCNICDEENEVYGSITSLKPDGSDMKIYARGVRNSVGFDWHPVTGDLWFTDNGRDWLGDDLPPDELNEILSLYSRVTNKTLIISKVFGIEGKKLLTPDDDYEALKDFNSAYEGTRTSIEKMHLDYQGLLKEDPELEQRLRLLPGAIFSGRKKTTKGTIGVFFCYSLPALDVEREEFTEEAGTTRWYLYKLNSKNILEDPGEIKTSILSKPKTPRICTNEHETLIEIRNKIRKHIKNTYLARVNAPIGVKPTLKCWMELNEG